MKNNLKKASNKELKNKIKKLVGIEKSAETTIGALQEGIVKISSENKKLVDFIASREKSGDLRHKDCRYGLSDIHCTCEIGGILGLPKTYKAAKARLKK